LDEDNKYLPGEIKVNKFRGLVHVNAWVMRKDFFLRIGGFDERLDFWEDWEFGVSVFKNGRVRFVICTGQMG